MPAGLTQPLKENEGAETKGVTVDDGGEIDMIEFDKSSPSKSMLGFDLNNLATFRENAYLAVSMGFWITLFYVPVCVKSVNEWMFVANHTGYDLITKPIQEGSTDFQSYWPNVVQLMFFTVFSNTGTTVQLGWQGLAGTFAASANYFIMQKLFPLGGKCVGYDAASGAYPHEDGPDWLRPVCSQYEDPNFVEYNYFIYADIIGFIFIVLMSNSEENTMKFGMSWHLTYMMAFISPAGATPSHSVVATSMFGVFLAIIVTLVPKPHLTCRGLKKGPQAIVKVIDEFVSGATYLFEDAINMGRYKLTAEKFAIETTSNAIPGQVASMKQDYDTSWWETFDLGSFSELRMHVKAFIGAFDDSVGGLDDVFFTLTRCVMSQDHATYNLCTPGERKQIQEIRDEIIPLIKNVNKSCMEILNKLANDFIGSGKSKLPGDDEKKAVTDAAHKLEEKYFPLLNDNTVASMSVHRRTIRTDMNVFVFATLALASKVLAFAEDVEEKATDPTFEVTKIQRTVTGGVLGTWKLKFNDIEKVMFAVRNTLSIVLTFYAGMLLNANIFTPYNTTMCATLALLISHFPGSAFYRNLMRLLGVTLGKVLPIIIMAIVSIFGRGTGMSEIVHIILVFLYMTTFAYMYYTSPMWAYVGCLVAGFGCYGLVGVEAIMEPDVLTSTFVTRYRELGCVTVAIFVQIFIDSIDTSVRKRQPRTIIVKNMRAIGQEINGKEGCLIRVFRCFFGKDFEGMKTNIDEAKGIMSKQKEMLSELQERTIIIRGKQTPFRYELCCQALEQIELLLGEAEVLICLQEQKLITKDEPVRWNIVEDHYKKEDFISNLKASLKALQTVLEHTDESKVAIKMKNEKAYKPMADVTKTVRVSTATRCLHDAMTHIFEIAHLCYASGVFVKPK